MWPLKCAAPVLTLSSNSGVPPSGFGCTKECAVLLPLNADKRLVYPHPKPLMNHKISARALNISVGALLGDGQNPGRLHRSQAMSLQTRTQKQTMRRRGISSSPQSWGNPSRTRWRWFDEGQITHLNCARLKYDLYDFFRGCFWACFLKEKNRKQAQNTP